MSPHRTAAPKPARPRLHWIDVVRGTAVLLVLLQHTWVVPINVDTPTDSELLKFVTSVFHPFRMPLLLFLSGLLLPRSVVKPLWHYTRGKLSKIVWPFLVWMVILAVLNAQPGALLKEHFWVGGAHHLWFLYVLMCCYVVGLVVRWVPAWTLLPALFAVLLLVGPEADRDLLRPLYWGMYFFLGAALGPLFPRIQALGWWFPAVTGAWTVAASWLRVERVITVREDEPWSFVWALGGILFVVWLGPRIPRVPFLEFCGQRSIILYCAHMPLLLFALRRFEHLHRESPVDHYLVLLVFTFGVPLALALLYPKDRWLFEFPPLERHRDLPVWNAEARAERMLRRVVALRHGLKRRMAARRPGGSHRAEPISAVLTVPRPVQTPSAGRPAPTEDGDRTRLTDRVQATRRPPRRAAD